MPSYYQNIYGYFDFEDIYKFIVDRYKKDACFLEIGVWLGKSACYMAELLKENGSNNKFYCLDHFMGEINAKDQQEIVQNNKGNVYNLFLENMENGGVKDYFIPLKDFSQNAAFKFKDHHFDFIFLDAKKVNVSKSSFIVEKI
jgi:predicted O-methyltransferase YrrM